MRTLIIMGPSGSGKSTHAELMMEFFKKVVLIDEWNGTDPLPDGALALTNAENIFCGSAQVMTIVLAKRLMFQAGLIPAE